MNEPKTLDSTFGPKCPYCGNEHTEAESWEDVVTLWGSESGQVKFECEDCCLTFEVNEIVTRMWESIPMIQDKVKRADST